MTENHNYRRPSSGTTDWHIPLNENFTNLDRDVEIRDTDENRTNYQPKIGAKFFATDTEAVYLGDGTRWNHLTTTGSTPSFKSVTTESIHVQNRLSATSVRAKEYNSKVQIRTSDDVATLQRKLDRHGPNTYVEFEPGTSITVDDTPIELYNFTYLKGMGPTAGSGNQVQLIQTGKATDKILDQQDPSSLLQWCTIDGITFKGNQSASHSQPLVHLSPYGLRMKHCRVIKGPAQGIHLDRLRASATTDNNYISNSYVVGNAGVGIDFDVPASHIYNVFVGRNGKTGIRIRSASNKLSFIHAYGNGESANSNRFASQILLGGRKTILTNSHIDAGLAGLDSADTHGVFVDPLTTHDNSKSQQILITFNQFVDEADVMLWVNNASANNIYGLNIFGNSFASADSGNTDVNANSGIKLVTRSASEFRNCLLAYNHFFGPFDNAPLDCGGNASGDEIPRINNTGIDDRQDVTQIRSPSDGLVVTHDGSGTGLPGTATRTGSQWLYQGGVTEATNAETPQGDYPSGQTVYFTDTGDDSGSGTYLIDDSGSPQGPL